MSGARSAVALAALVVGLGGCGLQLLDDKSPVAVANVCKTDVDCGAYATCIDTACVTRKGTIAEVLLEVVPDANSSWSGFSFLSMQGDLLAGDRSRNVTLPNVPTATVQVWINGEDLPADPACDFIKAGKQSIPARVQLTRTGLVGGMPIAELPSTPITLETARSQDKVGTFTASAGLVPGTYDAYIQPMLPAACGSVAARLLRDIEVREALFPSDSILALPTPASLGGIVQRRGGTLKDWHVELIDPREGRPISTSALLSATNDLLPTTNFLLSYQPLASASTTVAPGDAGPLVRISPPKEMAATAPAVYWDLAAVDLDGDGKINLDMSGVPRPDQLVEIAGHVWGQGDDGRSNGGLPGVAATLQFSAISLDGAAGLTAAFNPSVTSDSTGTYRASLFPGQYRVIVIPTETGSRPPSTDMPSGTSIGSRWATTETQWTIGRGPGLVYELVLYAKRIVTGLALAGPDARPAVGTTFEAVPSIQPGNVDVLRWALARAPATPQSASIPVNVERTPFSLPLDPGEFDLSLRSAESSNFAWWVWPAARVAAPDRSGAVFAVDPHLQFPVPVEGIIVDPNGHPLRNASVRAYAKAPLSEAAAKVGDARTDEMGRYRLRLPPKFGP